ncbi:MAG: hypothetical protein UX91_C0011G0011 [Candidatus Amesbacteria bacterium GW2011_GWB1_47_19]|nr:MAG: hypothetical protein UW51_C0009G0014 [Candidatus Amesbacteria bacterium GW2011_GWA1_44_24]KKU30830.1 MAG: hypothetical protein UX46_C0011G0011 [Candidatus Amesbacteria bacterium GW2011_GWC1_46_24]KKU66528.1 MAG: hypothetical protein UX91_C0011G0011 [Candidatus Amesbacteria bacterium GW2011_GWB1_47_19]OGD06537.1 MAG: hypothetical protein A2379_00185 [Candidatus Amesbacteria bacterium RIFOXYB1_FULL_47_13]HBC72922.1 hypothetical protein [Candidatus Amesbacteria bacterium]
MAAKFLIFAFLISQISILTPVARAQTAADWPMTAANPQRTSHNSVEVPGNLNTVWYRPIDPYIDNKVQLIASDNKIFLSTSKGLYAFDAATGSQLWVYGTEMPLGNSPTYANGILYVGGFDHKIHAVNAATGQLKSGWTFTEAGAGFDTNPLVVDNVVYAGNRDGYFYALDANTGSLKWKYQTGGPIHFSAAHKNGVVYFASNDAYAYALNTVNGSLIWKSEKFPGVGFDSYWPVIYTDTYSSSPTFGKDFVILAGSLKAGRWLCASDSSYNPYGCQIHSPNFEMYDGKPGCTSVLSEPYLWQTGTPTLKCDSIYNYYNNNSKWGTKRPWWRVVFILDRNTGAEQTPYAPFNVAGLDGDGQGYKQPPVVGGDGILYQRIGYGAGGNGGCGGWIAGWKFGTPYISQIASENSACDEPAAFTSGGNLIYYGEGSFNHEGFGTINTASIQSNDIKWTGSVSYQTGATTKYSSLTLSGKFGSPAGAYGYMDGFNNYSPIPYNGRLYVINGNVLYALSTSGTATTPLTTAQIPSAQVSPSLNTTTSQLQQKLYDEVQKMLSAGHLRPGFHSSGLTSQWMNGAYNYPIPGDNLTQYFKNPSDTVTTLIQVLEYITAHPENSSLQSLITPVKNYIQTNYGPGAPYSFTTYASIGWRNGAKREAYDDLPEFTAQLADNYDVNFPVANEPRTCIWAYENLKIASPNTADCWMNESAKSGFPPESLYAGWKYARTFPGTALSVFNTMKSKLSTAGVSNDMTDTNLIKYPYLLNQYIVGYRGYVELDKLANNLSNISQSSKYPEYTRLLNLRWANFTKDPALSVDELEFAGALSAARNFMYMTPELGQLMHDNVLAKAQATVDQYQILTPAWFVSKFNQSAAETYSQPLYDYPALFQARAYILKQPFSELVKYLDVPAFEKGDLFYIQNLVAALSASGPVPTSPPASPSPTSTPTAKTGDANGDNKVDGVDYMVWFNHYRQSVTGPVNGDFNSNGMVDGVDYMLWFNNYGK